MVNDWKLIINRNLQKNFYRRRVVEVKRRVGQGEATEGGREHRVKQKAMGGGDLRLGRIGVG